MDRAADRHGRDTCSPPDICCSKWALLRCGQEGRRSGHPLGNPATRCVVSLVCARGPPRPQQIPRPIEPQPERLAKPPAASHTFAGVPLSQPPEEEISTQANTAAPYSPTHSPPAPVWGRQDGQVRAIEHGSDHERIGFGLHLESLCDVSRGASRPGADSSWTWNRMPVPRQPGWSASFPFSAQHSLMLPMGVFRKTPHRQLGPGAGVSVLKPPREYPNGRVSPAATTPRVSDRAEET